MVDALRGRVRAAYTFAPLRSQGRADPAGESSQDAWPRAAMGWCCWDNPADTLERSFCRAEAAWSTARASAPQATRSPAREAARVRTRAPLESRLQVMVRSESSVINDLRRLHQPI